MGYGSMKKGGGKAMSRSSVKGSGGKTVKAGPIRTPFSRAIVRKVGGR